MPSSRTSDVSLTEAVCQSAIVEWTLQSFPEVQSTVSRIGRPEIATDPMGPDMTDTYALLKPHAQWREGVDQESPADIVRMVRTRSIAGRVVMHDTAHPASRHDVVLDPSHALADVRGSRSRAFTLIF